MSAQRTPLAPAILGLLGPEDFPASASVNALGLDLYRRTAAASRGSNFALSPYSIELALALAYLGAAGETRREMATVLRLPTDATEFVAEISRLQTGFQLRLERAREVALESSRFAPKDVEINALELRVANRLFAQAGLAFNADYLESLRTVFRAPLAPVDFREPETARQHINAWVEEQTNNKIRDLLPSRSLTPVTRLVLTNALYLKASWAHPFDAYFTSPQPFHLSPGEKHDVPTMRGARHIGYVREDIGEIIALDCVSDLLQFLVILPKDPSDLSAVANALTTQHVARWSKLSTTHGHDVVLYLPKFAIKGGSVPLGDALKQMGLKTAFDLPPGSADFSEIAPRKPDDYLHLSDVFHQTYVAVAEGGIEAAAATAVSVAAGAAGGYTPPPEVRVDRPFLFAIQERVTGACLFFGHVKTRADQMAPEVH